MSVEQTPRERAILAYQLRTEDHLTLDEIGRRLGGVSRERARQLVVRGKRVPRDDALKAMRAETSARQAYIRNRIDGLSQRTSNCLKRGLGRVGVEIDPLDVAAMSDADLLSLPNLGKASLAEIRSVFGVPGCQQL